MTAKEYDDLAPEDKRIKVAELCGWEKFAARDKAGFCCHRYRHGAAQIVLHWSMLPDYLNDLNAMRNAELTIYGQPELFERYQETLLDVIVRDVGYQGADMLVIASAAQRAKAFVITMTMEEPNGQ